MCMDFSCGSTVIEKTMDASQAFGTVNKISTKYDITFCHLSPSIDNYSSQTI